MKLEWAHIQTVSSKSYTCGFCSRPLASEKAYSAKNSHTGQSAFIYICHHCQKPTFFDVNDKQTPGSKFGDDVLGIDDEKVKHLYQEARGSFSNNAFTATVLCCRKLLMHISVSKGAEEGKSFVEYVEFLSSNNYVPPDARGWVDHIRKKGNEANHEILIMSEEEAKDLISFSEMLLKLTYEFPATSKKYNVSE
ncbi:DUF4145 domain-containing protein [Candidatus Nomurabacteria bacterium]|nr:DUF4145 domain-containing protein [Candidatus Nomurabacteria bacterium]